MKPAASHNLCSQGSVGSVSNEFTIDLAGSGCHFMALNFKTFEPRGINS